VQVLKGRVVGGMGHFRARMTKFPEVFRRATGEDLVKGTLNVDVGRNISPKEHFRIRGTGIDEPEQDLLFEVCRINGIWAYRIRPHNLNTGEGGHGDNILEIACSQIIQTERGVEISLFRDETEPRN
jgi:CTP-dependent riboflavin kinase